MSLANHFEILGRDGSARTGLLTTAHGAVRTPGVRRSLLGTAFAATQDTHPTLVHNMNHQI